jgi:hypothetical protein
VRETVACDDTLLPNPTCLRPTHQGLTIEIHGRFGIVPAARFRPADINQLLESNQHD